MTGVQTCALPIFVIGVIPKFSGSFGVAKRRLDLEIDKKKIFKDRLLLRA